MADKVTFARPNKIARNKDDDPEHDQSRHMMAASTVRRHCRRRYGIYVIMGRRRHDNLRDCFALAKCGFNIDTRAIGQPAHTGQPTLQPLENGFSMTLI